MKTKNCYIKVKNLTKIYYTPQGIKEKIQLFLNRDKVSKYIALQDITFNIQEGSSLGIIGENGAGKSTLLRIISGVIPPTSGKIEIKGRVTSVLELGMGFHPEFSGVENAILGATILGISHKNMSDTLKKIIEFAELGNAINNKLKTYSSGMIMRLAFAIATQCDPDILIIDEALAVGDGYFQKKCFNFLVEHIKKGKILLFSSHAMYYVTSLCEKAMWLEKGKIVSIGPAQEVVTSYENYLKRKREQNIPLKTLSNSPARIEKVEVTPSRPKNRDKLEIQVSWKSSSPDIKFHLVIGINRIDGEEITHLSTTKSAPMGGRTHYRLKFVIPNLPLIKGEYTLYVNLADEHALHIYDQKIVHGAFTIESPNEYYFGYISVDYRWEIS